MEAMKGKKSSVAGALSAKSAKDAPEIHNVVFACDAGMGSSAMGASVLRNKIKEAGFGNVVTVTNSAINNLKDEYELVVVHEDLAERAKPATPSALHVTVDNFMASPRYDEVVDLIRKQQSGNTAAATEAAVERTIASEESESAGSEVLSADTIVLDGHASSRDEAIDAALSLIHI